MKKETVPYYSIMKKATTTPFICGIAGGSGSGKSTLAKAIQKALPPDCVGILTQDSYYIDQSQRFDGDGGSVNFDHPNSLEFSLLEFHLQQLKKGLPVKVPTYDFSTHSRLKRTNNFKPSPIVLVDGTLLFSQPKLVQALDLRLFVDTPEKERLERRLRRDVQERGRTPDGVRKQFQNQVKPMHDRFIEGSKSQAHWVLSGLNSIEELLQKALQHLPLGSFKSSSPEKV